VLAGRNIHEPVDTAEVSGETPGEEMLAQKLV
jgi:hypothetical protein